MGRHIDFLLKKWNVKDKVVGFFCIIIPVIIFLVFLGILFVVGGSLVDLFSEFSQSIISPQALISGNIDTNNSVTNNITSIIPIIMTTMIIMSVLRVVGVGSYRGRYSL